MILNDTKLRTKLKSIIADSEVEDILLFGSTVRGKEKPRDIDFLIIFKNRVDKEMEYKIRKELEKRYKNVSLISKAAKEVLAESFAARESLLFEGFSLLTKENLAQKYGFSPLGMFKYDFKGWDKLKKTKFYYALNGRENREGIINTLNFIKLSDGILLSPLDKIEKLRDFLESWGIKYKYIPVIIPERLNKKEILELK